MRCKHPDERCPCSALNTQLIKSTRLISFLFHRLFFFALYFANPSLLHHSGVELFALNVFSRETKSVHEMYDTVPAPIPLLSVPERSWEVPLSAAALQPMCRCDSYCAAFHKPLYRQLRGRCMCTASTQPNTLADEMFCSNYGCTSSAIHRW